MADGAGTTSYTYDSAGRLRTMADPASGATLTYTYNPMSLVSQVSYGGSGTDTRTFGYDSLHRLTSDTLTAGSTTVASVSYGYNASGYLTSKTTTGFAGASANTYTYDQAGRLTSWNNGSTTTGYAYDGAGNRVQAGSTTYTYDARDELTSDGTSTYSYTADGDLNSVTGPSGTVASTSDAYGQQGAQGSQSDTYDGLGRDTGTAVTGGAATTLSYEGTTGQLTGDGATNYTWTPDGTLTGTATAGSSGSGVLDFTDRHTDLTGQFTASGGTLTGSRTFGPWGAVTATGGALTGTLGYQSQYSSPGTGQVDMGARWYNPSTGSFGNKDTVNNRPVPDSASASPFGYAADNPLDLTDPSGHTALDAHQLHLLHLAHLAAVAHAAHVAHVEHLAHLAYVAQGSASAAYTAPAPNPFASSRWTGNDLGAPTASGHYAVTTVPVSKPAAKGAAAKPADKPALSQQLLNSIAGNLGAAIKAGKKPQTGGCTDPGSFSCVLKAMGQTLLLVGGIEFDDPEALPGENPSGGVGAGGSDWRQEFDSLSPGKQSHVGEVSSEGEMRSIFDQWTSGAEKLPARGAKIPDVYKLPDGTIMQWRNASKSGGATIDIFPTSGSPLKVHLP